VNASLVVQAVDDVTVVHLTDADLLETEQIRRIGQDLSDLVEGKARCKLAIDFGRVRQLSSSILGVLVALRKSIERNGGRLVLCGLSDELLSIFRVTKLDRLFELRSNADEAVRCLGETADRPAEPSDDGAQA